MEDLTPVQTERLQQIGIEAGHIEDLLRHPGMKLLRTAIDNINEFNRKKWYQAATPEEAEKIRLKTRGYEDFFKLCEAIIKNGEAARKSLNPPSEATSPEQGE
jgi:hypothetical protein